MQRLCSEEKYTRLPSFIIPNHYDLSLTIPDLERLEYAGEVIVYIDVLVRTNRIDLHISDLEFENIQLTNIYSGKSVEPESTYISRKDDILKLNFKKPIGVGSYTLKIRFEGSLHDESYGLYCIRYKGPDAQDENMAVFSHFEPIYARRCFPCWDEPSFRATYKISITVPKKFMALSNMPTERIEKLGKLRRHHFEKTPPMCSHLLAFVVGEFGILEARSKYGVPVRILSTRGKEEQGRFALDIAVKSLKFYTDYFETAYPLPKLDLIAVPDSKSVSIENWGLVTFMEINLLVNPSTYSNVTEKWIASLVSHQVAHQWLGNLVGMEWWNQAWLLEACSQIAECLCVDYIFPVFKIWEDFALEFLQTSLKLDEVSDVHPVEPLINNPVLLEDFHDGLGYNKGPCLIKMLHHYVGDAGFRRGLKMFFEKHKYKNTSPEDFWGALEDASKKPVKNIMATWKKQTGFPVVGVFVTPGCDCLHYKDGITVNLVQSKFVMKDAKGKPENERAFWIIPISLITSGNPKKEMRFLMDSREMKIYIPDVTVDGWIKLNPGCFGYYRVQYSTELLERLIPPIMDQKLSTIDKIGILDDLFYMVKNGYASLENLLRFLKGFENEKEFLVWSAICRILNRLVLLTGNTHFEQKFEIVKKSLLEKMPSLLGWSKKSEDELFDIKTRNMNLGQTSWLDDEKMIKSARKSVVDRFPDDLKIFCYRTLAKSGGRKEFEALMRLYKTVDIHEQKRDISCGSDEKLLHKLLTFAISDGTTSEETVLIVMAITSSKFGKDLLWDYYHAHWRDILSKAKNKDYLSKMIEEIREKYATESSAMEIETFFNKRLPCNELNFRSVLSTLRNNASWSDRDSEDIKKFLSQ